MFIIKLQTIQPKNSFRNSKCGDVLQHLIIEQLKILPPKLSKVLLFIYDDDKSLQMSNVPTKLNKKNKGLEWLLRQGN